MTRPHRTHPTGPDAAAESTGASSPPELNGAMRTGHELILATRSFASDQPLRSWWYILSTALLLAAGLAGTLWIEHPLGRLAASVLTGLLTLRLFVIYHDQQHHAILAKSRLAEGFMRLFGIWVLSPSAIWRSSHNYHHNHNSKLRGSHIGSFPIMTADAYRQLPRADRWKYLFMRHPFTMLFGYGFIFLYGMCLNPFLTSPRKNVDGLLALLLHLGIGIALLQLVDVRGLLLTQTVPHFIACALGSYLFYVQHNFTDVTFRDSSGWTYEAAALESSSFLKVSPAMRWFTANIGYHHVHHLNAKIPFYRLPEAMRALRELQAPKSTSLNPFEVWRCLRIKVWDARRQRMIGLSEL